MRITEYYVYRNKFLKVILYLKILPITFAAFYKGIFQSNCKIKFPHTCFEGRYNKHFLYERDKHFKK